MKREVVTKQEEEKNTEKARSVTRLQDITRDVIFLSLCLLVSIFGVGGLAVSLYSDKEIAEEELYDYKTESARVFKICEANLKIEHNELLKLRVFYDQLADKHYGPSAESTAGYSYAGSRTLMAKFCRAGEGYENAELASWEVLARCIDKKKDTSFNIRQKSTDRDNAWRSTFFY